MKKMLCLWLVLVMCLVLPIQSLAMIQYGMSQELGGGEYDEEDLPIIYGVLNSSMPTRTGPGTKYAEPGTFYSAGDLVRIISVAYDHNDVPWVQVEVEDYKGNLFRAYTGLKRFDGVEEWEIPVEIEGLGAYVINEAVLYYGPGTQYQTYDWTLKEGRFVVWIAKENGYVLVDYESTTGNAYHFWIRESDIEYN